MTLAFSICRELACQRSLARPGARLDRGHAWPLLASLLALAACTDPTFGDSGNGRGGDGGPLGRGPGRRGTEGGVDEMIVDAAIDGRTATGSPVTGKPMMGSGDAKPAQAPVELHDAAIAVDAGVAVAPDAAPIQAGPIPSWAPSLVGRYAVRSFSVSEDSYFVSLGRDIGIAVIAVVGDHYELKTDRCDTLTTNAGGTARIFKPQSLSPLRQRLLFSNDTFSSEPVDAALGFDEKAAANCEGKVGAMGPKQPEQTWITGNSCVCSSDVLPKPNDCRVNDPDEDGLPGFTVNVRGNFFGALTRKDVYGVGASYSKLIEGRVETSGALTARIQALETALQYGCSPGDCPVWTGTAPDCGPQYTSARFVHIDTRAEPAGGWNCDAVMARLGELFPEPEPPTPPSCAR